MSYLRDLARKHLGSGYSKLKKQELVVALARFVPALKKLAKLAGIEVPASSKPAAKSSATTAKGSSPAAKASSPATKGSSPATKGSSPAAKASSLAAKAAPASKVAPPAAKPSREPAGKESHAVDKKDKKKEPEKKEPEKKATERKNEPEKNTAAPQGKKASPARSATPKDEEASASFKPAQVVNFPPRPRSPRSAEESWQEDTAEMVVDSPELETVFQQAAEPLIEGFFVARMMGERELRRHHLTEDQAPQPAVRGGAPGYEEELGELPLDYEDDLALALARDPHTLFITWDFGPATRARALEGLSEPRAMLRVYDGERLVREQEITLESRSFYIHGLPPGRPYRVEALFVGRGGRSRRLGSSSHPITLPRVGPSPDKSVRFMQLPPPPRVPVQGAPAVVASVGVSREVHVEEREYITWQRVPLPGSAELTEIPQSRRERIARSEERAGLPEHLEIPPRPLGSSEQTAGRGGSSEQTHWTPPPSGRGR
ncbi:MAG TPA: DUF4912 domain-containing protein [Hyalangium sp.]|nr:DUF4912 domain-containing protein [Hyalangium sp.]